MEALLWLCIIVLRLPAGSKLGFFPSYPISGTVDVISLTFHLLLFACVNRPAVVRVDTAAIISQSHTHGYVLGGRDRKPLGPSYSHVGILVATLAFAL